MTTLIRSFVPAWFKVFDLHPCNFSWIRDLRYPKVAFFDQLHIEGRARYFPRSVAIGMCNSITMAETVFSFAPRLTVRVDLFILMRCPDARQYSIMMDLSILAFSTDLWMKNKESSTKKRWWSSGFGLHGQPLRSVTPEVFGFGLHGQSSWIEHQQREWIDMAIGDHLVVVLELSESMSSGFHWLSPYTSMLLCMIWSIVPTSPWSLVFQDFGVRTPIPLGRTPFACPFWLF